MTFYHLMVILATGKSCYGQYLEKFGKNNYNSQNLCICQIIFSVFESKDCAKSLVVMHCILQIC